MKKYSHTLTIDGNNFNDLEGFYDEIARVFTDGSFPIGHNLDALNDLLIGGNGVYKVGEPVLIRWENANKSRIDLGYNATANYYDSRMKKCHPSNKDIFQKNLDDAKSYTGDTLFDIICKMLDQNKDQEHNCNLVLL